MSLRCVGEIFTSGCRNVVEVTLTFRWRTHHCRLVSMATVTSDERPAPALTQTVLIATATEALIVEEAWARAELRVLQRCADVTVRTEKSQVRTSCGASILTEKMWFFLLPQAQLPADHTGISVWPVRVTHCPPLAVQIDLDTPTAGGRASNQTGGT